MANSSNTKEAIVSRSLILIGEAPISSFTEDGVAALAAANNYNSILETALTAHRWLFASKKVLMSRLSNTPIGGIWDYGFKIPGDELRIVSVEKPDGVLGSNFEINGDVILANEDSLILEYIYKPDEQFYPPYFVKYLEYAIAAEFAVPVAQNVSKAQYYEGAAERQLLKARSIDSQSSPRGGFKFNGFKRTVR